MTNEKQPTKQTPSTAWKKQELVNTLWKPQEVHDELVGNVLEIREGQYGKQLVLNVDGEEATTPSHKHLQAQLTQVKIGEDVRIVYKGNKPSGKGSPTELYDVYRKE